MSFNSKIEFINNFNYSTNNVELDENKQKYLLINTVTYTDYNVSSGQIFLEKDYKDINCKASYGKGNVLYWEKENELS